MDINVEKELNVIADERLRNKFTVDVPDEHEFIQFSFSAKDSFERFEAVKKAQDILKNAIARTGGNMTTELMDAYEGLNAVMEKIKVLEINIVRVGR